MAAFNRILFAIRRSSVSGKESGGDGGSGEPHIQRSVLREASPSSTHERRHGGPRHRHHSVTDAGHVIGRMGSGIYHSRPHSFGQNSFHDPF